MTTPELLLELEEELEELDELLLEELEELDEELLLDELELLLEVLEELDEELVPPPEEPSSSMQAESVSASPATITNFLVRRCAGTPELLFNMFWSYRKS